jgi:heme/copper-type cytochrome/quinol oxidase subunit 4
MLAHADVRNNLKQRDMGTPQIILLTLLGIQLLLVSFLHGKPREGRHNLFMGLIDTAILIWILTAGGFFG